MKIGYGFTISILLTFISCNTVIKEAQNWMDQANSSAEVIGTYFPIEHGLVKAFLPTDFKQYTISEYKTVLDSSLTKKQVRNEMKRLESMRDLKGSFNLFFDSYSGSTYIINTLPYLNFSRNDAKMLLSMIKQRNNRISLSNNLNFKKLTATYTKNKEFTMFRSIFQIDNVETGIRTFSNSYIISANERTFMINLTTPYKVNFDGYIEKMKF